MIPYSCERSVPGYPFTHWGVLWAMDLVGEGFVMVGQGGEEGGAAIRIQSE